MVSCRVIEFSKLKCACNFILTEPLPGRLCLDYLYACRDRGRSSIVYKCILLIFNNKADTVNRDRSNRVVTFFVYIVYQVNIKIGRTFPFTEILNFRLGFCLDDF